MSLELAATRLMYRKVDAGGHVEMGRSTFHKQTRTPNDWHDASHTPTATEQAKGDLCPQALAFSSTVASNSGNCWIMK